MSEVSEIPDEIGIEAAVTEAMENISERGGAKFSADDSACFLLGPELADILRRDLCLRVERLGGHHGEIKHEFIRIDGTPAHFLDANYLQFVEPSRREELPEFIYLPIVSEIEFKEELSKFPLSEDYVDFVDHFLFRRISG